MADSSSMCLRYERLIPQKMSVTRLCSGKRRVFTKRRVNTLCGITDVADKSKLIRGVGTGMIAIWAGNCLPPCPAKKIGSKNSEERATTTGQKVSHAKNPAILPTKNAQETASSSVMKNESSHGLSTFLTLLLPPSSCTLHR